MGVGDLISNEKVAMSKLFTNICVFESFLIAFHCFYLHAVMENANKALNRKFIAMEFAHG